MTKGTLYDVSATLPTVSGATPVGIVGFGSNHNMSTNILMAVISTDRKTAYAKVECLIEQSDMSIRFDVLYIDA
jgi:hypothetical protein